MLTLKEWMELVDYRITEGSEYCWNCFGTDTYSLSSWNGDQDGWSFNIVFDTKTQEVYVVEVCDYGRNRAYRMINPDYKDAHDDEAKTHNVSAKEAWDDVDYVDLEVADDFIQKSLAIKAGEEYDTRVSVPLELPDDVMFELMKRAHERDITLNQMVEEVLWIAIRDEKSRQQDEDDGWDDLAENHWDDDGDEMLSDLQDLKPAAKMKAKKKKKK